MSFEDGWAAINMQMPKRVPRTEFSAHKYHYELMKAVTGIDVAPGSSDEVKEQAREAFVRIWNYDIETHGPIHKEEFGEHLTNMGHSIYEAEGADYDDNIYSLFSTPEEALSFNPWEVYGKKDKKQLTRLFNEHYKDLCAKYPTQVNTSGVYITLITGLTFIFGWEMLLTAAGMDPNGFGRVVDLYASWIQQYYDALAETDIPIVCSHDDIVWTEGAIFHPDWYRSYIFPNYKRLWKPLIESGKKVLFQCDGNYTQFVGDILDCGANGLWFEIFTDLEYIAEHYGKKIFMIGNADTRVLLQGGRERIRAEVERCMTIGKKYPGFFMSVTNHIPPNTPVENALYYNDIYEELCKR